MQQVFSLPNQVNKLIINLTGEFKVLGLENLSSFSPLSV